MNTLSRRYPIAASLGLSLLAAGCGGGGGDAGSSPLTIPTTPVAISAANQDGVSRAAVVGAQGGFASGTVALSADGRAHAMGAGGAGVSSRSLAAVFAPLALRALRQPSISGRASIAAAIDLGNNACSISGTSHAVLDDRDGNQSATVGDSVTVSFTNCEDFAGEKVNGTLSMTVTQLTAGALTSFTASATMAGLSVSGNGHAVTYDGDMTLSYAESSTTVTTVQATIANQLTVRITSTSYTDTIAMLAGYRITTVTDDLALPPGGTVPGKSTTTASGDVASTAAGGKVTVSTLAPVVEYDANDFPTSGQLRATGTTSSVTLTALAGGQIRIDRDDGNDGSIDATKTVDWSFLL